MSELGQQQVPNSTLCLRQINIGGPGCAYFTMTRSSRPHRAHHLAEFLVLVEVNPSGLRDRQKILGGQYTALLVESREGGRRIRVSQVV